MNKTPQIITKICIIYPIATIAFILLNKENVAVWLCRIAPVCALYLVSILYYAERIRWMQERKRWELLMEKIEKLK